VDIKRTKGKFKIAITTAGVKYRSSSKWVGKRVKAAAVANIIVHTAPFDFIIVFHTYEAQNQYIGVRNSLFKYQ
jgi:hypothetical protein